MTEKINIDCKNVYIKTSENVHDKILEQIEDPNEKFLEIHSILGELKAEILEINKKIDSLPKPAENTEKKKENLPEIEYFKSVKETVEKIQRSLTGIPEIPIQKAILGEWKMISFGNFVQYNKKTGCSFETFSENVKFEMKHGKLVRIRKSFDTLTEDVRRGEMRELFVEKNHLKSFFNQNNSVDRFIENGKLYIVTDWKTFVFKRIYKKIG